MTRVNYVAGIVLAGTFVISGGVAAAQSRSTKACVGCGVAFSVGVTSEGSHLEAVGRNGVVVHKRVGPQGLRINVAVAGDAVEIVAGLNGTVTIARRGKRVSVSSASVVSDHEADVKALTAGSAALAAFERMVLALGSDGRPEATSVVASFALLRALHGDATGNALLAARSPKLRGPAFLPIAQRERGDDTTVGYCWGEYELTLSRNSDRYNRCLRDYWWNQPVQYACGLEFAMVAELALFRLISCSGGFPLP